MLVVHPSLPVHSLADLLKLAKEKPASSRSEPRARVRRAHLCAELLSTLTGIDINYIPYKGSAPALTDMLGGQVSIMFVDLPPALPLVREGKIRAVGSSSIARVPAAPEIVPLAEQGLPGYEAGGWLMFAAPAATPPDVVNKLHAEMKAITATPEIQQRLTGMGLVPIDSPPVGELKVYVKSEIERWGKVIRAAGLAESE